MAVRQILHLHDAEALLRRKAKRVTAIDGSLQRLIDDMIETMHAAGGVGLAAPQIGLPLRLAVIQVPEDEVRVLINPEMVRRSGERLLDEGCLSLPGYFGPLKRSLSVVVKARDRQGRPIRIKAQNDLLAEALEHETDHLNGVLFIDHMESLDLLRKVEPRPEEPS